MRVKTASELLLLFVGAVGTSSPSVITPPDVVTAGVGTDIQFNKSASSCSSSFDHERGCDWPFFRPWLVADPTFDNTQPSDLYVIRRMCILSPCVSSNLTSFEATIPPTAVPNGGPYEITYEFFNLLANGSADIYVPTWAAFEGARFNITGAKTSWTPYDLTGRYESDNSFRAWYRNVSCDVLECARKCANEYVAPKVPFVGGDIPEVDDCVEACPGYHAWDPQDCITENAQTSPTTTTATTATLGPTSSSTSDAGTSPQPTPSNTGTRLREISLWLLFGLVALFMMV